RCSRSCSRSCGGRLVTYGGGGAAVPIASAEPSDPMVCTYHCRQMVHAYERSNRVYNYELDPCAPIYITVGDGGNRENVATSHADDPGNCPNPLSTYDKHLGGSFCATNSTTGPAVKNETHALWTWHRNQDMYNSVGDEIYIVRQPNKCPVRYVLPQFKSKNVVKVSHLISWSCGN
ncbi:Purple acid phosphatase 15, partial [Ananas comosus]